MRRKEKSARDKSFELNFKHFLSSSINGRISLISVPEKLFQPLHFEISKIF